MRSRRGREQVDRRSIDDSKKEEGGCKARRSKRRSAGCVHFYRWKVVYTRSILRFSLCACRSFRAAPCILVRCPGVSFGGSRFCAIRASLRWRCSTLGSLSRAFRGYEIFGHRESMMEWWTGWLIMVEGSSFEKVQGLKELENVLRRMFRTLSRWNLRRRYV